MPKLEVALTSYLTADGSEVAAMVGDRVFPVKVPEGAKLPCISWRRVSASRQYTHDPYDTTDAWVTARVQFSCWATTPLDAIKVGEAVMLALSGYEGDMAGQLIGSSDGVLEMDDYQTEQKLFRRVVDFIISYEDDLHSS